MIDVRFHNAARGRQALRAAGALRAFRRKDRLMIFGAPSTEVVLIERGLVKVSIETREGAESVLGLFGPGALLGEVGVLNGCVRSANVIAVTSGCAHHIPAPEFRRLHGRGTAVREVVDESHWHRLRTADRRHLAQTREVPARVAEALLHWAREFGRVHGTELSLYGISQRELAQAIGASDKHVESALAELRSAGLVRTARLRFHLPQPDELEKRIRS